MKPKCSAVEMQANFQKVPIRLCCSIPGQAGNRCLYAIRSVSGHFLPQAQQDFSSIEMRFCPPFYPALCAFRNIPTIAEKLHHRRVEQSITAPSPFRGRLLPGRAASHTGASGTGGSPDDDSIIINALGERGAMPCFHNLALSGVYRCIYVRTRRPHSSWHSGLTSTSDVLACVPEPVT